MQTEQIENRDIEEFKRYCLKHIRHFDSIPMGYKSKDGHVYDSMWCWNVALRSGLTEELDQWVNCRESTQKLVDSDISILIGVVEYLIFDLDYWINGAEVEAIDGAETSFDLNDSKSVVTALFDQIDHHGLYISKGDILSWSEDEKFKSIANFIKNLKTRNFCMEKGGCDNEF